ncbi:Phenylacetic acid catabolic protein [Hyphococcus sp.]|uniref:Phenylacetic acid catabolic protein n=1 Tax=Hyphococcus sp. TaxID=2038636 RepID=UPI003CCBF03D
MNDETDIQDYLAKGGKLSAPDNAPPRYRAELLRIMASFVDSELAGAAGFADLINAGPGIKEKITAARIVAEKLDHAERVLKLMGEFGVNTDKYMNVHPWTSRVSREDDLRGERRHDGDMRLNVFHYPLQGWSDAVVMNVLMGEATVIQIGELAGSSYQPLAETFADILPRERRHAELGYEGLVRLVNVNSGARRHINASIDFWRPRVADSFGGAGSQRTQMLQRMGLRHTPNETLLSAWRERADTLIENLPN